MNEKWLKTSILEEHNLTGGQTRSFESNHCVSSSQILLLDKDGMRCFRRGRLELAIHLGLNEHLKKLN